MTRTVCCLLLLAFTHAWAQTSLDVPLFKQEKNGCGAASVAMILHYWSPGAPASADVYRRLYDSHLRGIPLAEMRRFLEDQGFRAFTLRGEWTDIEQHLAKGRPIIVGLKQSASERFHFAVVTGHDSTHVWLNDPGRKRPARVTRADFTKKWEAAEKWMLLATPKKSA